MKNSNVKERPWEGWAFCHPNVCIKRPLELPLPKGRRFLLHRQSPRTRVPRSYTVSTSFTSRSPYGRSVFVPTNPIYYDILQKTIFFFSPKGVASHPLPEGRGFRATLDKDVLDSTTSPPKDLFESFCFQSLSLHSDSAPNT